MPLQQRDLLMKMNIPLNSCERVKKSIVKRLLNMLFDRRWRLDSLNILINKITVKSLTILIFAIGWAVCGWPQPGHMLKFIAIDLQLYKIFQITWVSLFLYTVYIIYIKRTEPFSVTVNRNATKLLPEISIGFYMIKRCSRLQQPNLRQQLKLFAMLVKVYQSIIVFSRVFQSRINHHEVRQKCSKIWHCSLDRRPLQLAQKTSLK